MPKEAAASANALTRTMLNEHLVDSKLERNVVFFQDPAKKCGKIGTILSAILGFLCSALPYLSFFHARIYA